MSADLGSATQLNPNWSGPRPLLHVSSSIDTGLDVLMAVLAILGVYYAYRLARKEGRANPIWIILGGTLAVFYEPLGDLLVHVNYYTSQPTAVASFGFHVPGWMVGAYTIAAGVPVIWLIDRIRGGVTLRTWMVVFFLCVAGAVGFELPLIYLGAIEYYGEQPLTVLGYPLWMAFTNSAGLFFAPATIIYLLTENGIIDRRRSILLVPLVPIVVAGSHAATAFPVGYIMNSGSPSNVSINAVALLSMGLSILIAWTCGRVVARPCAITK